MILSRTLSLTARVVVATAWASCLVILGLLAIASTPPVLPVPLPRLSWVLAGVAAVAAGLFLFMTVVADRLVPSVGRRQAMWAAEMTVFAAFIGSGAVALLLALYGGA